MADVYVLLAVVVVFVAVVGVITDSAKRGKGSRKSRQGPEVNYKRADFMLTKAEHRFY